MQTRTCPPTLWASLANRCHTRRGCHCCLLLVSWEEVPVIGICSGVGEAGGTESSTSWDVTLSPERGELNHWLPRKEPLENCWYLTALHTQVVTEIFCVVRRERTTSPLLLQELTGQEKVCTLLLTLLWAMAEFQFHSTPDVVANNGYAGRLC